MKEKMEETWWVEALGGTECPKLSGHETGQWKSGAQHIRGFAVHSEGCGFYTMHSERHQRVN